MKEGRTTSVLERLADIGATPEDSNGIVCVPAR